MFDDSYVLVGARIVLDKEKVEREGVYDYGALLRRLDYIFKEFGVEPLINGYLYGNKKGDSYKVADENQSRAMIYLGKCKWFVENVKNWEMSFNYARGENRGWEDVLKSYRELLLGVEKYVE